MYRSGKLCKNKTIIEINFESLQYELPINITESRRKKDNLIISNNNIQ